MGTNSFSTNEGEKGELAYVSTVLSRNVLVSCTSFLILILLAELILLLVLLLLVVLALRSSSVEVKIFESGKTTSLKRGIASVTGLLLKDIKTLAAL